MNRQLVVAHPSADVYGSDLQLLETIRGMVEAGWSVVTFLPQEGPLVPLLADAGSGVEVTEFPVLRKALLSPAGLAKTSVGSVTAVARVVRSLRQLRAGRLLVNTLTIPVWIVGGRVAGVRVTTHVHEAEDSINRFLQIGLASPLLLSQTVVVNSRAARDTLVETIGGLDRRIRTVHNGVSGPQTAPSPARSTIVGPARVALIARLSPRKGVDVALDAIGLLAAQGRDVHLELCGTIFPGYEWYEAELRARAQQADLAGRVTFAGYVNPTWDVLAEADVVLVPSRAEPFGNTAVEALLAERPLVASAVQGLKEVVKDGVTGVLVPSDDPPALAEATARLLDDRPLALSLAKAGREDALDRFTPQRYREQMRAAIQA